MLRNVNHAANFIFLALEHIFRCPFYCVCAVCGLPYKWFDLQMFVALLNNNAQLFFPKISNKYHAVGTFQKSNKQIVQRGKLDTLSTYMHSR
jgi:5-formyltetrahydrofolate cyclo-ligase